MHAGLQYRIRAQGYSWTGSETEQYNQTLHTGYGNYYPEWSGTQFKTTAGGNTQDCNPPCQKMLQRLPQSKGNDSVPKIIHSDDRCASSRQAMMVLAISKPKGKGQRQTDTSTVKRSPLSWPGHPFLQPTNPKCKTIESNSATAN